MDQEQRAQELVERYADFILRLSYAYLKNTHDAQDICQDVLLKLLTERPDFESREHERSWVARVTANACKDLLKSAWRRRTCGLEEQLNVPAPEVEDGGVLAAVNRLPARYRTVLYLYYYEGYQAAEIGRILGIPTATVNTRLARGRGKLKLELGGTEYEQQTV